MTHGNTSIKDHKLKTRVKEPILVYLFTTHHMIYLLKNKHPLQSHDLLHNLI